MPIVFCNSNDKTYQRGLNALLSQVFFDFSFWYDLNLWDERYESYAIVEDGRFVSNICVFKTRILWRGRPCLALSLGAVCTDPQYRGRGHARTLMEHVLGRYPDTPMYLSANEGVLDFYPRFGFRRVFEKQPALACSIDNDCRPVRLAFDDPKVTAYVRGRRIFSTIVDCANADTVTLFHIHLGPYKDCLYELADCGVLLVASQEEETLSLHGAFAPRPVAWSELVPRLPFAGVRRVEFGFAPDVLGAPFHWEEVAGDPLFVRGVDCDLGDFKFPDLCFT